jgi:hypothetical protein
MNRVYITQSIAWTALALLLFTTLMTLGCRKPNSPKSTTQIISVESDSLPPGTILNEMSQVDIGEDQVQYVCFTLDSKPSVRIWIKYAKNGKAIELKYLNQSETLKLKHLKEEYKEGGAYPTIINYYEEIYNEKVNGTYILTHAGNWDYVKYISTSDSTTFNFTVDHSFTPYSSTPCFD